MGKTDKLDRVLLRLPSDVPSEDLAKRVYRYVQRRRQRRMFIHFGISLLLAVGGLWLSLPLVSALSYSADLSNPALNVLLDWLRVALAGLESYVNYAWNGFTGVQSNLAAPINISVCLGIAALALSVLIALGQLLPQHTGPVNKGASA